MLLTERESLISVLPGGKVVSRNTWPIGNVEFVLPKPVIKKNNNGSGMDTIDKDIRMTGVEFVSSLLRATDKRIAEATWYDAIKIVDELLSTHKDRVSACKALLASI